MSDIDALMVEIHLVDCPESFLEIPEGPQKPEVKRIMNLRAPQGPQYYFFC